MFKCSGCPPMRMLLAALLVVAVIFVAGFLASCSNGCRENWDYSGEHSHHYRTGGELKKVKHCHSSPRGDDHSLPHPVTDHSFIPR